MKVSYAPASRSLLSLETDLQGTAGISGRATGDAAYRILIPREKLESDPELLQLVTEKVGIRWMGPG